MIVSHSPAEQTRRGIPNPACKLLSLSYRSRSPTKNLPTCHRKVYIAISTRLLLPSAAAGKSGSISWGEMRYSNTNAHASSCLTSSLGVSLTGSPAIKSGSIPSGRAMTSGYFCSCLSVFGIWRITLFQLKTLEISSKPN